MPWQYTDDSQLMLATIRSMTSYPTLDINNFVKELLAERDSIRGAGRSTWTALNRLKEVGPGESGIEDAAGCGAMTRTAPAAILAHNISDIAYEMLAEDVAAITHKGRLAKTSVFLYGGILANLLDGVDLSSYQNVEKFVERCASLKSSDEGRVIKLKEKIGRIPQIISSGEDYADGLSGAIWDVLPAALYCFLKSPDNFEASVFEAVNLGGDTDSIGFATGQLSGAYNGIGKIPDYLINGLEKNDEIRRLATKLFNRIYP
ncbi:MAG: ADP-ribosylglycohydrolase family protein [Candidatus Nanoarchaeia archaeon]